MATNMDRVEYLTDTVERNRYFYGKLMTVRDFLQEQQYFNSKRWLINRLLFGSGIVCGLAARPSSATEIEVDPGLALDPQGREITVLQTQRVDLKTLRIKSAQGAQSRRIRLCLAYHECPKEPVPSVRASACDEVCESNRVSETFTFEWMPATPPDPRARPCEDWLNRRTVVQESRTLRVERLSPAWVREGRTFEVAVKVTALADTPAIRLTETVAGAQLVEPTPAPTGQTGQFPTPPVSLQKGEFFIYVYQVQAPNVRSNANVHVVTLTSALLPTLVTQVEVVREAEAHRRERHDRFGTCDEGSTGDNSYVAVAELTVHFTGSQVSSISDFNILDVPRGYNLERVGQLLDCLREQLQAEEGSQRPGHAFITFKDTERAEALPIAPTAQAGTSYTVARGDHRHALLLTQESGLEFPAGDVRLRVNGAVGGGDIDFLHPVLGQDPALPRHLVTKRYVDAQVAGLDWQESVRSKERRTPPSREELAAPPHTLPNAPTPTLPNVPAPTLPHVPTQPPADAPQPLSPPLETREFNPRPPIGKPLPPTYPGGERHRYLLYYPELSGEWRGHHKQIAEWNGEAWVFTAPDEATAVFVDDEKIAYLYLRTAWTPFLATPEMTAGRGLYAEGAYLNVGEGRGLSVTDNEVSLQFHDARTQSIGTRPLAGDDDTVARGDHTHALPLAFSSGLEFTKEFGRDDDRETIIKRGIELPVAGQRLRINGDVGGERINFLNPVSGQDPYEPSHLTTKRYVDAKVAGLDWQESVLTKGRRLPPFTRDADFEEVEREEIRTRDSSTRLEVASPPFESGEAERLSSPIAAEDAAARESGVRESGVRESGTTESAAPGSREALFDDGRTRIGERYLLTHPFLLGEWAAHRNQIATWTTLPEGSLGWHYTVPSEGTAVFVEDENVAYLFVDGRWTPFLAAPEVTAGEGLYARDASLGVGAGEGIVVRENDITLLYEDSEIQPIGTGFWTGESASVARGDHTHALPLSTDSGLMFADAPDKGEEPEGDRDGIFVRGFRVNGTIGGRRIAFKYPVTGADPVESFHLATKNYVDSAVAGLDWQASVKTKGLTRPPAREERRRGDRYLLFTSKPEEEWAEHAGSIATWNGSRWNYKAADEGMAVFVEDENKAYVFADGKWTEFLAAPPPVVAGGGLTRTGDALSVGQGSGIVVREDDVSVAYAEAAPPPIGSRDSLTAAQLAGAAATLARSDHTHALPLVAESGLEFVTSSPPSAATTGFRVNGRIAGSAIEFLQPVAGRTPTAANHLATKAYVDGRASNIAAGSGLARTGDTLSVVGGTGITSDATGVSVKFGNNLPNALAPVGDPGALNAAARSDHTHPLPQFTTGTSTGAVVFRNPFGETEVSTDMPIDTRLRGFVSVQLALQIDEDGRQRFFSGYPPNIEMGAQVIIEQFSRTGTTQLHIYARSPTPDTRLPDMFTVRWFAATTAVDLGTVVVTSGNKIEPDTSTR